MPPLPPAPALRSAPRAAGRRAAAIPAALAALAALAGLAALPGCTSLPEADAARDVRALALALQARDRAGIDRRIDRPALRAQLTGAARVLVARQTRDALGRSPAGLAVGLAVADAGEPVIEFLVNRMLEPDTLADIAALSGLAAGADIPSAGRTRLALRRLDDGRVCLPATRSGPCGLVFTDGAAGWRLSAIDPGLVEQGLERQLRTERRRARDL